METGEEPGLCPKGGHTSWSLQVPLSLQSHGIRDTLKRVSSFKKLADREKLPGVCEFLLEAKNHFS